ncbi:MAG: mqnA [Bacteroidetes bacterium]|nr:mqnA [Bacteroidota bacterium]
MPEVVRNLLGVPEASYLQPLLYGLRDSSADLELLVDFPSQLALRLQQRVDSVRCAFLSPIDYARHGGDYLVVPGVGVSSSSRTDTIQLFVNPNVQNVETIAVDIRVTSEIILAKIILAEKFPNLAAAKGSLQFIPMLPKRDEMLRTADAALVVNFSPHAQTPDEPFALDLVDEWNDLTGLPYVHGVWVGHDEAEAEAIVETLLLAKEHGVSHLAEIAEVISTEHHVTREFSKQYLSGFSYGLAEEEQQGFAEFVRYAYYHGILPDVPDLIFFEGSAPPAQSVN